MSDLLVAPSSPGRAESPGARPQASPVVPRRVKTPRWRDSRLVVGVLLILVSVVLGARFIGSATRSSQWLSLTRSLPAGHVLVDSDLVSVKAHLPTSAAKRYFAAKPAQLVGRTLGRSLTAGELLPADAVAATSDHASRTVPLVVKAGRLPALASGDHVDVYVLSKSVGGTAGREIRVLSDVEFVAQDPLSSGDTSVQLRVAPAEAIAAIAASQSSRVDVVRVERDSADRPGDPGPSSIAAYDGS